MRNRLRATLNTLSYTRRRDRIQSLAMSRPDSPDPDFCRAGILSGGPDEVLNLRTRRRPGQSKAHKAGAPPPVYRPTTLDSRSTEITTMTEPPSNLRRGRGGCPFRWPRAAVQLDRTVGLGVRPLIAPLHWSGPNLSGDRIDQPRTRFLSKSGWTHVGQSRHVHQPDNRQGDNEKAGEPGIPGSNTELQDQSGRDPPEEKREGAFLVGKILDIRSCRNKQQGGGQVGRRQDQGEL